MVVKSDDSPAPIRQRPAKQPRKLYTALLNQPAARVVLNMALPLLMLFAVLSGYPDLQQDLEKMGIYLGPTHL